MRAKTLSNAVRLRVVAAVMLVVSALVLFMANRVTEKIEQKSSLREVQLRPLLQQVNEVVDTLLDRFQVDRTWVTSWNVFTRDKRFIRQERRVYVPSKFVSLDFNHDLARGLSPYGVRVIASERTREMSVSMHMIHEGMVIESITFVLKRDLN